MYVFLGLFFFEVNKFNQNLLKMTTIQQINKPFNVRASSTINALYMKL